MATGKKVVKKRKVIIEPYGQAHIKASFNNIIVPLYSSAFMKQRYFNPINLPFNIINVPPLHSPTCACRHSSCLSLVLPHLIVDERDEVRANRCAEDGGQLDLFTRVENVVAEPVASAYSGTGVVKSDPHRAVCHSKYACLLRLQRGVTARVQFPAACQRRDGQDLLRCELVLRLHDALQKVSLRE